ncbi:uncharacterized protein C7orf50 homolog [Centroberyx affinis]|uniref:uncharacterized protein C7orf50 homolog n=1 Tax=Centroberyx affinis TaxID=166261 RepID=UPI003A5BAEF0
MAKNKSFASESKGSGPKRKKQSSDEMEVCVKEMTESKVKKKRKNTEVEEAPLQVPDISIKTDNKKQEKDIKHKKKQTTEKTKKKKKQMEISEPPSRPAVIQEQEEEEEMMEGEEDLSPEERRVLERKMKKILKKEEKKKLKSEPKPSEKPEGSAPIAPQQALDYLTCWAENRKEWKFQKTRQTWLLQRMFDSEKIPDESFSVLLQYLEGLRGGARDTTVQKATALVQQPGQGPDDRDGQQRAHRARQVIQLLT